MTDAELIIKMRELVEQYEPSVEEMVLTMSTAADRMEALVHDFADHLVATGRGSDGSGDD